MSAPVKDCPQRDDTPERVRAYTPEQLTQRRLADALLSAPQDVFDAAFGIEAAMDAALAKAEAMADKIHAAWEACRDDD